MAAAGPLPEGVRMPSLRYSVRPLRGRAKNLAARVLMLCAITFFLESAVAIVFVEKAV